MLREPRTHPGTGTAGNSPARAAGTSRTAGNAPDGDSGPVVHLCVRVRACERQEGRENKRRHKAAWGNCYSIKFNSVWIWPEALHIGCRAGSAGLPAHAGIDPSLVKHARSVFPLALEKEQRAASPAALAGNGPENPPCRRCSLQCLPCSTSFAPVHISAALHSLSAVNVLAGLWNNFISTSTVSSWVPRHGNFCGLILQASQEFSSPRPQAQHRREAPA